MCASPVTFVDDARDVNNDFDGRHDLRDEVRLDSGFRKLEGQSAIRAGIGLVWHMRHHQSQP